MVLMVENYTKSVYVDLKCSSVVRVYVSNDSNYYYFFFLQRSYTFHASSDLRYSLWGKGPSGIKAVGV